MSHKTERRKYYRIDDETVLEYRMLSEEEYAFIQKQGASLELDNFSIHAKLDHITREAKPLLSAIEAKS